MERGCCWAVKRAEIAVSAGKYRCADGNEQVAASHETGCAAASARRDLAPAIGVSVVLDVGANIDVDPAQLTEFAIMGEAYYKAIHKVESPSIGLLNVGTEDQKGNAVIKAAHERLSESQLELYWLC